MSGPLVLALTLSPLWAWVPWRLWKDGHLPGRTR